MATKTKLQRLATTALLDRSSALSISISRRIRYLSSEPPPPKGTAGSEKEEKEKGEGAIELLKQKEDGDVDGEGNGGMERVNKATGEVGGPRGPEPTRYGDWEKNGRCSDF